MERIKTFNGSAFKYYSWETASLFNSPKWRRLRLPKRCLTNTTCLNHKQDFPVTGTSLHFTWIWLTGPVFLSLCSRWIAWISCSEITLMNWKEMGFSIGLSPLSTVGWRDLEVQEGLSGGTKLSGHCSSCCKMKTRTAKLLWHVNNSCCC